MCRSLANKTRQNLLKPFTYIWGVDDGRLAELLD